MQQFLQKIKTAKQEKLQNFSDELAQKEKEQLHGLKKQIADLTQEIAQSTQSFERQQTAKQSHEAEIQLRFAAETRQQELLSDFWSSFTQKHFAKKAVVAAWVEQQLSQLQAELESDPYFEAGVVRAGASYEQLKKTKLPANVTLEKSADLASEPGFIFTDAVRTKDVRLAAYLATVFIQNKPALYKVAFK